ncbi:MAG: DUF1922 domain-containing protein [Candidatus Thermoplasmatota archaeon]|nr:DUF1922 domain-containing protein [Candidatus Thermoplasmatota archaeon]
MYGVVVCPKCQRPLGVRLGSKTTSCQCGKRIYINRMKVLFSTDEPRELPLALGRIRAQLSGSLREFEEALEEEARPKAPDARGPQGRLHSKDKKERALEVLRSLSEAGGGFELSTAEEALEQSGLKGSAILEALLRENLVYESKRGLYRVV